MNVKYKYKLFTCRNIYTGGYIYHIIVYDKDQQSSIYAEFSKYYKVTDGRFELMEPAENSILELIKHKIHNSSLMEIIINKLKCNEFKVISAYYYGCKLHQNYHIKSILRVIKNHHLPNKTYISASDHPSKSQALSSN